MEIFLDSADIDEIREFAGTGLVDGVTTNPSLILKSGRKIEEVIKEICDIIPGSVSAEVVATEADQMIAEGQKLRKIAPNVTVKLPLTEDGLKACYALTEDGATVNVTLCFSANQALLAAKAGATYISPFVGRLDDIGQDGMFLIEEICTVYRNYPELKTKVLAASIRHTDHMRQAALLGADVATLPPKVIRQMMHHPLTDNGLAAFLKDWEKTGQTILS